MKPYRVELGSAAAKAFHRLPSDARERVKRAPEKLSQDAGQPRRIGGKAVKTIRGVRDSFHRLRVGDYRVMYDVIDEDRAILVLGIVHRGDLERWLRGR